MVRWDEGLEVFRVNLRSSEVTIKVTRLLKIVEYPLDFWTCNAQNLNAYVFPQSEDYNSNKVFHL